MMSALEKLIKRATTVENAFTGYGQETAAKLRSKKEGRSKGLAVKLKDGTYVAVGPVGEDGAFKLFGKGCEALPEKVADLLSDEEPAPKPRKERVKKEKVEAQTNGAAVQTTRL